MSEIKTTREQVQTQQEDWLRAVLNSVVTGEIAANMSRDIVDQLMRIEGTRSTTDLLRDMVEDAGGGYKGFEEIELLMNSLLMEHRAQSTVGK